MPLKGENIKSGQEYRGELRKNKGEREKVKNVRKVSKKKKNANKRRT
jgi:hypothetical protein